MNIAPRVAGPLLCASLLLAGCGTVQHKVVLDESFIAKAGTKFEVQTVSNRTGQSFDVDVEKMLRDALDVALKDKQLAWVSGGGAKLSIDADIVQYEKGDAFKRWLLPGWGSTVLIVKATLVDGERKSVGVVDAKRTVDAGGGYTIGAWEYVFQHIATDIVADLQERVK